MSGTPVTAAAALGVVVRPAWDRGNGVAETEATAQWFAIWTRSQCETLVEDQLAKKRFEVFLPRIQVPSRRRDRHVVLSQPLFPGYVFVHVAPTRKACIDVASTDGVVRMIGEKWDSPYPIADDEVESVRRIVQSGERVGVVPWIRIGDRVRIIAGALAGLEGFVQAWRAGRATFVVSLDLLQRSVGVEVPADVVERI
jgi:transcription termination/antitermination protein NusG